MKRSDDNTKLGRSGVKLRISLAFILLCEIILPACTTGEKANELREGMSIDQVVEVMGRPDGFQRSGDFVGYQYTNRLVSGWAWDRADYYAIFEKGRLVQWGPGEVRPGTGPNVGTLIVIPVQ